MENAENQPPVRLLSDSESDFDIYFEYYVGTYRPHVLSASREWHPSADMYETESCVLIRVDLAGMDKKDVQITLDKDQVILQGVRRERLDDERKRALAMEVPYGPFRRVFELPSPVCAEDASAEYTRGFLMIKLQKREKPLQRRTNVKIH